MTKFPWRTRKRTRKRRVFNPEDRSQWIDIEELRAPMARFFGTVQGGRGMASRLGHATSGLNVTAQTWEHHVNVYLFVGKNDDNWIEVRNNGSRVFLGPVASFTQKGLLLQTATEMMTEGSTEE